MFKKNLTKNHFFFFLSIIFEKDTLLFIKKNDFFKNTHYVFFDNFNILKGLKFFYEFKPIQLVDFMSYDYIRINNFENVEINSRVFSVYNFFSIKTNTYLNFIYNPKASNHHQTLHECFKNAIWLEREQREAYGLVFDDLRDSRNLLLDYNFTKPIMLKSEELNMSLDKNSDVFYENNSYFFDYYTI